MRRGSTLGRGIPGREQNLMSVTTVTMIGKFMIFHTRRTAKRMKLVIYAFTMSVPYHI
jgi:hypothetical protein